MSNFTPQEIEEFLREFFNTVGRRQYIGARYVPIFGRSGEDTFVWDNSAPYEPLTIVTHEGNSYTSRTYVPEGIDILDTQYWVPTGNYNAQVEQYRREVVEVRLGLNDVNETLPISDFDSTNTVKAYVDEKVEGVEELLPSDEFDSVNTVKKKFDDIESDITELADKLPASDFDDSNTVKNYIDTEIQEMVSVDFVFDTVQDMQNSRKIKPNTICKTNGYSSLNDGGGCFYIIKETATPNGMDILECRTYYAQLMVVDKLSIISLGARNNQDATAIIRRALAIADKISLGGKTVTINEQILIPSNRTIDGEGGTIQVLAPNGTHIRYPILVEDKENVTFKNLYVEDTWVTGAESDTGIIVISASRNILLDNVDFSNSISDGLYVGYTWYYDGSDEFTTSNIEVRNCNFHDLGRTGIAISSGENLFIHNNVFAKIDDNLTMSGIDVEPETGVSHSLYLRNVRIYNNLFYQPNVAEGRGITFAMFDAIDNDCDVSCYNNTFKECRVYFVEQRSLSKTENIAINFGNNTFINAPSTGALVFAQINNSNTTINVHDIIINGCRDNNSFPTGGAICFIRDHVQNITISDVVLTRKSNSKYAFATVINFKPSANNNARTIENCSFVNIADAQTPNDIGGNSIYGRIYTNNLTTFSNNHFENIRSEVVGEYYQQNFGSVIKAELKANAGGTTISQDSMLIKGIIYEINVYGWTAGTISFFVVGGTGQTFPNSNTIARFRIGTSGANHLKAKFIVESNTITCISSNVPVSYES